MPPVLVFTAGSGGRASKFGDTVYLTSGTGGSVPQIQGILSTNNGATWGTAFNITNDPTASNVNPSSDYDSMGNFYIAWEHKTSIAFSIEYVKLNASGPGTIQNLGGGSIGSVSPNPRVAVDGSGNVFVVFAGPTGGLNLAISTNNGASFGAASPIISSFLFSPFIAANGSDIFVGGSTFGVSGMATFPEEVGVFSSNDGTSWSSPMTLHTGTSTDTFAIPSVFFLGVTDPTVVDVGANEVGSSSGTLAFADFGDASGSGGFTTETVGSNFSADSGYSRSDGTVEIAAINASDNSTHLLQGTLPTVSGFSDLKAGTDSAQQVSISGDDNNAFIVQTITAVPGPIEVISCH